MFLHRVSSLIKFLIGILVLQGVTVLLTYTALQTEVALTWSLFVAVGAACGLMASFWFESIAGGGRQQALARQQRRYAREREKIRLDAERDKARLTLKHTKTKGNASAKLKTGIAVGGMAGVGVAMMAAQLFTAGLLVVSAAGGAALGYGVRVRQEKRLRGRSDERLIANSEPLTALSHRDEARNNGQDERH